MIFNFEFKTHLVLLLIPQILVGSNLSNQFAITVFSISRGSVFQCSKLVGFLKYTYVTISSCYGPIPLALGLIGTDGGLSTL